MLLDEEGDEDDSIWIGMGVPYLFDDDDEEDVEDVVGSVLPEAKRFS